MRSTISFSSLRNSMARIVPVIIILIATGILVFTSFAILMDHPTDFSTFHLMGTDQLGRDIFSATIIGVRVTLLVAILATLISIGIGTMLGLLSGYYGGGTDTLIMRFTDIFFVIPAFVLMIIVASVIGSSLLIIMTVIGIFSWATTARIVRGQVLSIKERAYVERVRSVGGGDLYIIFRHILPAVLPVIVAQTILLIINSIFFMISLNFVGIGDPAVISWGSMLFLAQNQGAVSLNLSWLFVPPGLAVVILIVGVALLGFSFDEVTNPRLRRR
jgi:peptide/nickel transport system permease protein